MARLIQAHFILLAFLFAHPSFADCKLSFNGLATNQYVVVDAETINKSTLTKTVNFTVENTSASDCYYFITMDEGGAGNLSYNRQAYITHALPVMFQNANSDSIAYQLYSQSVMASNIVKSLNHAVFQQNVLGPRLIRAGQNVSESFLVHVPAQPLPNLIAESYQDDVMLTMYQSPTATIDFVNDCPTCVEEEQQPLNIQFGIMNYVTLSIGNSYNPNTRSALLDFGELETSKEESFSVFVGGRTGSGSACSIAISSENGSKLVREDIIGAPKENERVNYTIRAQSDIGSPTVSTSIDLSTPNVPVNLATSSTPFLCGGNNKGIMGVEVYITIGDVDRKKSGIYRDTITIEATIGL